MKNHNFNRVGKSFINTANTAKSIYNFGKDVYSAYQTVAPIIRTIAPLLLGAL